MGALATVEEELDRAYGPEAFTAQPTADGIPTLWLDRHLLLPALGFLKREVPAPFLMLYDLTAVDERERHRREGMPAADFTVVYHLLSLDRNADVRLKVALAEPDLTVPTATAIWPAANWYEREVWDLFGIRFDGHPHLSRILLPPTWQGHPLRKDHPARATEMGHYHLDDEGEDYEQEAMRFRPENWGMQRRHDDTDFMFLNLGPNHPSAHGVFRVVLQLDGEEIVESVPDIGFHHRAAEKMGERQSWHTYIPYTDRVDYLGGVMNNLPYVMALEQLAGIEVPERVQVVRVMLCELFRISSHLLFYGTYAQDIGEMSPIFYMFSDRQKIYDIIEAVCGFRMHPAWFRIGGLAADLPRGWDGLVRDFLDYMPARLDEYDKLVLGNRTIRRRTEGIGVLSAAEAIDWGVTGPNLRASGVEWDFRKQRPYSGYDQFEFDIPTAEGGDSFDRCAVRVEEMRQSLRIIRQCLENMPPGPHKAHHPLTTPPPKDRALHDIESLISHFLGVSWGPVMPAGEVEVPIEGTKGAYSYYLTSDGGTASYRTRIRTPSFPHLQVLPELARHHLVADMIAILGSIDFVMADVDR
ncbi:NADH:ubiquinone oxidoreductase [Thiohalorhabdus denitrificans]|uniref:NADH-quinone oxidoreductase subunit C/D n=1 Tax=Thiohalorhabdus denitrificans TaxID=381306 RepID=A0A0P9CN34_9GAMM|nr:NADH-quinone oxidoreductase subunit C/D [Thiohalorhabdus denitrificans]KPV40499.1 NADH:ubiquinone oxidoreductase [Thiohalorhabdus denitrificans]SCY62446.1 NADH dehydrogenase subunit C /NADH dehydrogenase subunit D [Thiohalorhabdus denitrificans]